MSCSYVTGSQTNTYILCTCIYTHGTDMQTSICIYMHIDTSKHIQCTQKLLDKWMTCKIMVYIFICVFALFWCIVVFYVETLIGIKIVSFVIHCYKMTVHYVCDLFSLDCNFSLTAVLEWLVDYSFVCFWKI